MFEKNHKLVRNGAFVHIDDTVVDVWLHDGVLKK